jgi:hypothetical protein
MMTSPKEKRGTISARRRRQLRLLVAELQKLQTQKQFQDVRLDIQDTIDEYVRQEERTREADRQDVLDSLTNWRGAGSTADDIVEDTGLSERAVRGVLDEFTQEEAPRVVITGERQDSQRGRPAKVYDLANV